MMLHNGRSPLWITGQPPDVAIAAFVENSAVHRGQPQAAEGVPRRIAFGWPRQSEEEISSCPA